MYKIAVDLGVTKILIGIVDHNNNILSKKSICTNSEKGPENAIENIAKIVNNQLTELSIEKKVCKMAVCAPGPIDIITGEMVHSVNMNWGVIPFRNMIQEKMQIPVFIEHDAKAAAIGEFHYGVEKKIKSMVYIVIGSGVGGAIIIDGKLYRGERNYAGEVGHFTIDYDGDSGLTDIPGNVQSFMAGPSLAHRYCQLLKLENIPLPQKKINGVDVGELACKNDPYALKIVNEAGVALGTAVASIAMILDIRTYVIGGSVAKLGDILLEPARESVSRYCFASFAKHICIMKSSLEDDAPLLGCAHFAEFGI